MEHGFCPSTVPHVGGGVADPQICLDFCDDGGQAVWRSSGPPSGPRDGEDAAQQLGCHHIGRSLEE